MGRSPKLKLGGGGSLLDLFYKGVVLFGGLKKGPLVRELQICTLSGDKIVYLYMNRIACSYD